MATKKDEKTLLEAAKAYVEAMTTNTSLKQQLIALDELNKAIADAE